MHVRQQQVKGETVHLIRQHGKQLPTCRLARKQGTTGSSVTPPLTCGTGHKTKAPAQSRSTELHITLLPLLHDGVLTL